jgi:hypothetical protein
MDSDQQIFRASKKKNSAVTIRKKVIITSLIPMLCCLIIGLVSLLGQEKSIKQLSHFFEKELAIFSFTDDIASQKLLTRHYENNFILSIGNRDKQDMYLKKFNTGTKIMKTAKTVIQTGAKKIPSCNKNHPGDCCYPGIVHNNPFRQFYKATYQTDCRDTQNHQQRRLLRNI